MDREDRAMLVNQAPPTNRRVVVMVAVAVVAFVVLCAGALVYFFVSAFAAPARPEWDSSRPAFDRVVEALPPQDGNDQWAEISVPPRLGDIGISSAYRVGPNVVFYGDEGCGILDDAGIAYMPNGIDPSLANGNFESPDYAALGGPWYSFCASW